jgi:4-amino-4-deoxy-L-arabinose transferase-like glycosyltransferase
MLLRFARFLPSTRASTFDLAFVLALFVGGATYHWNFQYWAIGLISGEPYGDAFFWWDGAARVSDAMIVDHPGKGLRPGYFLITGLSLAAFGTNFDVFHKFLLLNFLSASAFLYFALRQPFGRLAAAAGVGLLVINPYTAEWIATTTTDGLGLVLHLASLACLLVAVQRNLSLTGLCGFGPLFAAANLTRPLLMPFIGIAVLVLVLAPARGWRSRLLAAVTTVVAFAVPTVSWMAVQSVWVGEWSVSTNDASALYAASTPQFQVWTPAVYDGAKAVAVERYKVVEPTTAQINAVFKRLTIENYRTHVDWHLDRAVPHVWTVASVSPSKRIAQHGTEVYQKSILSGLAGALALLLLARGFVQRAGVLLTAAGVVWLSPHVIPLFTLGGCGLALLRRPGRTADLSLFLVACYWLVGVLALYLTGGTWVQQGMTHINALGARIGSQFFFANDLLACAFLVRVSQLHLPADSEATTGVARIRAGVGHALTAQCAPAAVLMTVLTAALLVGDGIVLAVGLGTVARRAVARKTIKPIGFPDPAPVVAFYKQKAGGELVCAEPATLRALLTPNAAERREGPDVLATGTTGPYVWEMTGQQRSQTYFHVQQLAKPARLIGDCLHVEFPFPTHSREWGRRQGAFILRGSVDRPATSNLPYYLEASSVRGFVPLNKNGSGYDFDRAVWFPLTRYASQLAAAGDLGLDNAVVNWFNNSGPAPYQRRVQLTAKDSQADGQLTIRLDRASGHRTLRFGWQVEKRVHRFGLRQGLAVLTLAALQQLLHLPAQLVDLVVVQLGEPELQVWAVKSDASRSAVTPVVETKDGIAQLEIDCSAPDCREIVLSFRNLPAGPTGGVWIYELNLTADDFKP